MRHLFIAQLIILYIIILIGLAGCGYKAPPVVPEETPLEETPLEETKV